MNLLKMILDLSNLCEIHWFYSTIHIQWTNPYLLHAFTIFQLKSYCSLKHYLFPSWYIIIFFYLHLHICPIVSIFYGCWIHYLNTFILRSIWVKIVYVWTFYMVSHFYVSKLLNPKDLHPVTFWSLLLSLRDTFARNKYTFIHQH